MPKDEYRLGRRDRGHHPSLMVLEMADTRTKDRFKVLRTDRYSWLQMAAGWLIWSRPNLQLQRTWHTCKR